jgi:lipid A 3-O-deacylase
MFAVKSQFLRTVGLAAFGMCLSSTAFAEESTQPLSINVETNVFTSASSDNAVANEVGSAWESERAAPFERDDPANACLCVSTAAFNERTTGAISVTIENDSFTGSDDAYSNGVGLTWTSRNTETLSHRNPARAWAGAWSFLPGVRNPDERYVSLSIAQEMHTPEDITLQSPPLDDRPYAGVVFLDAVVYRRSPRMNDAWTLRLGVVGPASHADDTQTWFHDVVDADEPQGWETQLPNEVIVNLGYTANFAGPAGQISERISWRVTPTVTAEAGTYATVVGAGALFEFGYNLPRSAQSVSSLRNGLNAASVVGWGEDETELSVSGNIGLAGYAIERFLPLDGTYFRDSRSVGYDPTIAVVTAGATVRYGDYAVNFNVAFSEGSIEGRDEVVEFGALTISRRFR